MPTMLPDDHAGGTFCAQITRRSGILVENGNGGVAQRTQQPERGLRAYILPDGEPVGRCRRLVCLSLRMPGVHHEEP